ncbi:TPA: hypothetical protein ACY4PQ_001716 [Vibrio parahaemolyticus]
MADKFFKLTCNKKVSHKAVKESGNLDPVILFIKASTQKQAKTEAESMIEAKHPLCTDFEHKYGECFKGAIVEAVSEEDYNLGIISEEYTYGFDDETPNEEFQETIPDKPYPELGNDGFYSEESAEISNFILDSSTENMKAAKIFVLNVGPRQWAHGYKMKCGSSVQHEQMNLDRTEETRLLAIDSAEKDLKQKANGKYEFGDDPNQKPFYSSVMEHDFAYDLLEPSENFIRAIKEHRDFENAVMEHSDYAEVVESHFADIWPLDKSPEQAIEHINSMVTISVLYDLEAFTESFKPYLPSVFSEKTKESMKHIEEIIDKPAANDSEVEPRCWKAALPIDDERYAVIAIKDCGDSGWAHASALFKSKQLVFGDDSDFGDEFEIDRKTALGKAVNAITEVMYKFGVDAEIVSEFARDYVQRFEENYIELGVDETLPTDEPKLKTAIRERLKARPQSVELKEKEVEDDFNIVNSFVTENTDIDGLIEAILNLSHCKPLFNEQDAKALVEQFNTSESEPNDFNAYARRLLHIAGEIEDVEDSMIAEIEVKLSGVFSEREFKLQDGEFYSEAASNLMNHVRNMNAPLLPELLNLRALRRLVDDATPPQHQKSGNNEPEPQSDIKYSTIHAAIVERLNKQDKKPSQSEIAACYEVVSKFITENTHLRMLAGSIVNVDDCNVLFNEPDAKKLVDKFSAAKDMTHNAKSEHASGHNEPEPPQNLPKQGENKSKVTSNERKVTKQEPLPQPANDELIADSDGDANGSGVPQNIVEQEPANDPEIPEINLDESNSNMSIWNHAFKTDLAFTKRDASTGFLSINPQYRGMKATEIFGSEGKGWGVDVKRYWIEDGMPILINGQPIGICESVQHMEIELWYIHPDDGKRYSIPSFGETERFYWSHNYSRLIKNTDCYKKSLTDAKGKALAMLGICGDVYMGEYDDAHIETLNHNVVEAAKKARHLEEEERIRKDVTETLESIKHELETVSSKAEAEALEHKGAAKIIALPDISQKQKAIKESYTKALRRYYEKAIDRLTPKQEAK